MSEEKEELRDAIVILPIGVVTASSFEGRGGPTGAEQKIRNITGWASVESQLVLMRGHREVARFRDWVGVRSQAVDS